MYKFIYAHNFSASHNSKGCRSGASVTNANPQILGYNYFLTAACLACRVNLQRKICEFSLVTLSPVYYFLQTLSICQFWLFKFNLPSSWSFLQTWKWEYVVVVMLQNIKVMRNIRLGEMLSLWVSRLVK